MDSWEQINAFDDLESKWLARYNKNDRNCREFVPSHIWECFRSHCPTIRLCPRYGGKVSILVLVDTAKSYLGQLKYIKDLAWFGVIDSLLVWTCLLPNPALTFWELNFSNRRPESDIVWGSGMISTTMKMYHLQFEREIHLEETRACILRLVEVTKFANIYKYLWFYFAKILNCVFPRFGILCSHTMTWCFQPTVCWQINIMMFSGWGIHWATPPNLRLIQFVRSCSYI